mgnify:CR=1 FL=1
MKNAKIIARYATKREAAKHAKRRRDAGFPFTDYTYDKPASLRTGRVYAVYTQAGFFARRPEGGKP